MTELQDLERRIDQLERVISKSGLRGDTYFPGSLQVVRCDKDSDGDFDSLVSTSWDGDSFSTSTGTINWNAEFGVPRGARMVFVTTIVRDSSATDGAGRLYLRAKSTTASADITNRSRPNNAWNDVSGCVAVAQDGTSYYSIEASDVDTCDIHIRVVAYAR